MTGGADSLVNIWVDRTQEKEEEEIKVVEERMLKEQELMTSIYMKDYNGAINLAFELGHSYRLWTVLSEIMEQRGTSADETEQDDQAPPASPFDGLVASWDDERLAACLAFVREWNTNARRAGVAQALLSSILRSVPFERLKQLPGIASLVDGLLPYTERHFLRIDKLAEASFVIDYTLTEINELEGR